jgi:hypothetical protein
VDAELVDGTRERLGERRLGDVRRLHVHSRDSGYVIEPLTSVPGRLRLLHPAPQDSAPEPGPTLAIALLSARPLRPLSFAVRIVH